VTGTGQDGEAQGEPLGRSVAAVALFAPYVPCARSVLEASYWLLVVDNTRLTVDLNSRQ
jgi:hypothetical protein